MSNKPVQISKNCWKHIGNGCVFYTKTIDRNSEYHREDGPAIEWENGSKEWYLYNKLHRENGPAIEWANGDKHWIINGKLHRENGPAIEFENGIKEWYYYDEHIYVNSQEEFEKYLKTHKQL